MNWSLLKVNRNVKVIYEYNLLVIKSVFEIDVLRTKHFSLCNWNMVLWLKGKEFEEKLYQHYRCFCVKKLGRWETQQVVTNLACGLET